MAKFSALSLITVLAVVLAGCGGSSSTPGTESTTTAITSKPDATAGTKFAATKISGTGTVLVDAADRTVYVLTSGGKKNLPCTDGNGCTAVWPDLPLPKGMRAATAGAGVNKSLLGTMKLNGKTYATYNGYLMYAYTGDPGPGQANGQGIDSFGGTWNPITPAGKPLKSSTTYYP